MREKLIKIHAASASVGLLLITVFFIASLISELIGDKVLITNVKTGIFYAIWFLIPAMIVAGITGNKMAPNAKSGLIGKKKQRMPFIAANGLLVLTPAAVYLYYSAVSGQFDGTFYLVQVLELAVGFINICLMSMNLRDGLSMSKKRKIKSAP